MFHALTVCVASSNPEANSGFRGNDHLGASKGNQMKSRIRKDIRRIGAGVAFHDAERQDPARASAERHGVARRTAQNWRTQGHPAVMAFLDYLESTPDPFRVLAECRVNVKGKHLRGLSVGDILERYGDLVLLEKDAEAEDLKLDCTPGASWSDRALASARDASINEEKAALERELEARRVTWMEVQGR